MKKILVIIALILGYNSASKLGWFKSDKVEKNIMVHDNKDRKSPI